MTDDERLRRAQRARDLLANDLFQEALTGARDAAVAVFLDPRSTPEQREDAHLTVRGVDAVLRPIVAWRDDLKMLAHMEKERDRG